MEDKFWVCPRCALEAAIDVRSCWRCGTVQPDKFDKDDYQLALFRAWEREQKLRKQLDVLVAQLRDARRGV